MAGPKSLNVNGKLIDLNEPRVMGILNLTPDSFYAGSRVDKLDEILDRAKKMVLDGATFLDIGGYSSRPHAEDISLQEEISRIEKPIMEIRSALPDVCVSIDTFRSEVAEAALKAGAQMINDISGGQLDSRMLSLVADARVPYVGMHMRGTPQSMAGLNQYDDLMLEVTNYFTTLNEQCLKLGINDLIIDPGFGFAKNVEQNFELLKGLEYLRYLDRPIMVGVSRKSMIYKTLEISPEDAVNGTTALNTLALYKGANILRVHDVKPAIETIKLMQRLL